MDFSSELIDCLHRKIYMYICNFYTKIARIYTVCICASVIPQEWHFASFDTYLRIRWHVKGLVDHQPVLFTLPCKCYYKPENMLRLSQILISCIKISFTLDKMSTTRTIIHNTVGVSLVTNVWLHPTSVSPLCFGPGLVSTSPAMISS